MAPSQRLFKCPSTLETLLSDPAFRKKIVFVRLKNGQTFCLANHQIKTFEEAVVPKGFSTKKKVEKIVN